MSIDPGEGGGPDEIHAEDCDCKSCWDSIIAHSLRDWDEA